MEENIQKTIGITPKSEQTTPRTSGRTKIIIRRTFGERDLTDLYTDYVANKILAARTDAAVRA